MLIRWIRQSISTKNSCLYCNVDCCQSLYFRKYFSVFCNKKRKSFQLVPLTVTQVGQNLNWHFNTTLYKRHKLNQVTDSPLKVLSWCKHEEVQDLLEFLSPSLLCAGCSRPQLGGSSSRLLCCLRYLSPFESAANFCSLHLHLRVVRHPSVVYRRSSTADTVDMTRSLPRIPFHRCINFDSPLHFCDVHTDGEV